MKTKASILQDIKQLTKYSKDYEDSDSWTASGSNKIQNTLKLYRKAIIYLETNPRQEFVESQLVSSEKRLQHIVDGFSLWKKATPQMSGMDEKKAKQIYNAQMGVKAVKTQILNLKYILS